MREALRGAEALGGGGGEQRGEKGTLDGERSAIINMGFTAHRTGWFELHMAGSSCTLILLACSGTGINGLLIDGSGILRRAWPC